MRFTFILLLCLVGASLAAQETIYVKNQSFEGTPKDATMPNGWEACHPGTTPDILPGFWNVFTEPFEGNSYIGLITREDGSYESIGQPLSSATTPGECYSFSIYLARSETYELYNFPVRLKIFGGNGKCDQRILLDESNMVEHTDWRKYHFSFSTKEPINYITFEVCKAKGVLIPYKGNLLLDALKEIKRCPKA